MLEARWIRQVKDHPLTALTLGLAFGTLLATLTGCADGPGPSTPSAAPAPTASVVDADAFASLANEPSPEELAAELGLPTEEGGSFDPNFEFSKNIPQTRVVPPSKYADYRLHVEIFRKSSSNPVLGAFQESYVDALVLDADGTMTPEQRLAEAKKRFKSLASKEFAVETIDGVPTKAHIISAGVEASLLLPVIGPDGKPMKDPVTGEIIKRRQFKTTPPGAYRLDPLAYELKLGANGKRRRELVAQPWIRSRKYENSQMFWALWIKGGYFIHSSPYYAQLGQPASKGCIRQTFPDAMELFSHLVQENMSGMILIQKAGTRAAVARLQEVLASGPSPKDMHWLLGELQKSSDRIRETVKYYRTGDIEIKGHSWLDATLGKPAPTLWPLCGLEGSGIDCFKAWGVRKPKNSAN
jgi:hypothetical protein